MSGLTAEETAVGVGQLLWWSEELAAALADRRDTGSVDTRVWSEQVQRRLRQHGAMWAQQLPESVLLHPQHRRAPAIGHADAVTAVRNASADELGTVLDDALEVGITHLRDLVERAGPVSDGALRRSGRVALGDLDALRAIRA